MPKRKRIKVRGVVQGVGFRPFVYRLAHGLKLAGFVRNTTDGVDIEVEGTNAAVSEFFFLLKQRKPPAASIDDVDIVDIPGTGEKGFKIQKSAHRKGFTHIAPDIATCSRCYAELFNKMDRRYRYPFVNCTNCGPRYSIIKNTPYDRSQTTMASFTMCSECAKEFEDVLDRRFHAQPDCCRKCGPVFTLYRRDGHAIHTETPIQETIELLKKGMIVAIKGIGGFHVACDATNNTTVKRLRVKKNRPTKPFAIMVDPRKVKDIAYVSKEESRYLLSPIAPIVLLRKRQDVTTISEMIAPANPYIGVMVPYAPVHYLLIEKIPYLVMTSGNLQDEPIVTDDSEVDRKLKNIVSYVLTHDRGIENRCDDSVGFVYPGKGFSIMRRSRGYAPTPIVLTDPVIPTLAVGPYLKNTFVLARDHEAYVSPHIGDLDNMETMEFFQKTIEKYRRWFAIEPVHVIHDLHPDYLSTKFARGYGLPVTPVQHHVAHMVSCLGEYGIKDKAIGIIFDGTGYGLDGKIWGGEFFVGDVQQQKRVAHLEYLPLPGGEASIKKPYRIAIAYAHRLCNKRFKPKNISSKDITTVIRMLDDPRISVETSSLGRLFDCVSAMIGLTKEITYEAEAAINLEYIAASGVRGSYPYSIDKDECLCIRLRQIIEGILSDLRKEISPAIISAKFHNTVIKYSLDVVNRLSTIYRTRRVCLSGGVFQNRYLLTKLASALEKRGYTVYIHRKLPTNDGCISYGQVIYGNYQYKNKQDRKG